MRSTLMRTELMFQVAILMRKAYGAYSGFMGTALITGATSGIGREFCWQVSKAGHNLVIVARDQERLEALAHNIRRVNNVKVEVLPADLADPEDLADVCMRLTVTGLERPPASVTNFEDEETLDQFPLVDDDDLHPVGLLINAAGFGMARPFLDNAFDSELYGLDVMVRAVMATCYYAGRAMRDAGRGTIINVSSVAADSGMGPYSAHKAWVRSFSEGLAEELRDTGVSVTAVMPGLVKTEFHARAGVDFSATPQLAWSAPKKIVEQSLEAARRGQTLFTPTVRYKVVAAAQRVLPRSVVRKVMRNLPHM